MTPTIFPKPHLSIMKIKASKPSPFLPPAPRKSTKIEVKVQRDSARMAMLADKYIGQDDRAKMHYDWMTNKPTTP